MRKIFRTFLRPKGDKMATSRTEEYLESLFKLQQNEDPVSISRLAKHLNLSAASASEMAKKLKVMNLVSTKGKKIYLTKKGDQAAKKVVRRHRLLERFLTDVLGLPWDEVHEEACRLEHGLSPKVEEKLAIYLENPQVCPHGHPIPDNKGVFPQNTTSPLSSLKPGDKGIVSEVPEEDPEMLKYLERLGLRPQVEVIIEEVAPLSGPFLIRIGKSKHALGRDVATLIQVKTEV